MREIKFRVPVICQNGHKGYWHYRIDNGSDFAKTTDSQPPKNICKCPKTGIGEGWSRAGDDEEYTGLKDKNGREVYEGDIVKIKDEWTEPILDFGQGPTEPCFHLAPIKYEDGAAAYIADISDGADFFSRGPHTLDEITKEGFEIEVIGNIYEHGELLND